MRHFTLCLTLACALPASAAAQEGHLPWKTGTAAPAIAGVHLNEKCSDIQSTLGQPDQNSEVRPGLAILGYTKAGLLILCSEHDGAEMITLRTPTAGALGDVRVGDTRASVVAKWGAPATSQGPNDAYIVMPWGITVQYDAARKVVAQLAIAPVG